MWLLERSHFPLEIEKDASHVCAAVVVFHELLSCIN